MVNCCQKNTQESVDIDLNNLCAGATQGISITYNTLDEKVYTNSTEDTKAYGDANPVMSVNTDNGVRLNLTKQQTELLKNAADYLNEASTVLYFSGRRFLSTAAKDFAHQIRDAFHIG